MLAKLVLESGLTTYLDCCGVDAILDNKGAVPLAVFESKSGRQATLAEVVVDATGDGDIYSAVFAPAIRYSKKYCLEDCRACTQVYPSGAIQSLSLDAKNRHVIGETLVDGSLCILALGQKDCDARERACPFDAVHTQWDEEKYIAYPVVKTDRCNGCGGV